MSDWRCSKRRATPRARCSPVLWDPTAHLQSRRTVGASASIGLSFTGGFGKIWVYKVSRELEPSILSKLCLSRASSADNTFCKIDPAEDCCHSSQLHFAS